ncbi:Uncharacterized protein HZ326_21288 [Fusarium oxysporum f. sp. albedinis]|nr:Uncharacterized protein HZ326_21288 [Fusarium oxysporum f. sp. albedinis]
MDVSVARTSKLLLVLLSPPDARHHCVSSRQLVVIIHGCLQRCHEGDDHDRQTSSGEQNRVMPAGTDGVQFPMAARLGFILVE